MADLDEEIELGEGVTLTEDRRRTWDKEYFARKIEQANADAEQKGGPAAQRAPLVRRDQRLSLESKIGKTSVVSATGSRTGGYFCELCQCALKDSGAYLDHINGRKHQRELGMSMRTQRASLQQVQDRFSSLKRKRDEMSSHSDMDNRLKAFYKSNEELEEEERERIRRKKLAKKARKLEGEGISSESVGTIHDTNDHDDGAGAANARGTANNNTSTSSSEPSSKQASSASSTTSKSSTTTTTNPAGSDDHDEDEDAEEAAMLAMMGMPVGFGSSKKKK